MKSKYAKQFKDFAKSVSTPNFAQFDKALNSLYVNKKNPTILIQPIGDEFFPVPIHRWIQKPGATENDPHNDFVCRRFIGKPCYICDTMPNKFQPSKPNRPGTEYLTLALKLTDEDGKVKPEYRDYYVSKEYGEKILKEKKFADAKHEVVGDRMQFFHLPSIGLFSAKKTVSEAFGAYLMDGDASFNDVYRIRRSGERLETKYTVIRKRSGFNISKSAKMALALALHMTIDDYIDTHVSLDWYNTNLELSLQDDDGDADDVPDDEGIDDSKESAESASSDDDDFGDDGIEDPEDSGNSEDSDDDFDDSDDSDDSDDLGDDEDDDDFDNDDESSEDTGMTESEFQDLIDRKYRGKKTAKKTTAKKSDDEPDD